MKITRKQLRQVINEELAYLVEAKPHPDWNPKIVDGEKIYRRFRRPFEYKIVDEEWHARRISLGPDARWKNVQRFAKVVGKLNREFPSAMEDSKITVHRQPSLDAEYLITKIEVASEDDGTENINIFLTKTDQVRHDHGLSVSTFTMTGPSRIVMDIADGDFISDLDVNEEGNLVEKVTVETIEDDIGLIVRVEVFLTADKTSDFKHSVEVVDDQILLNISPEAEE